MNLKKEWERRLAVPENYKFQKSIQLVRRYEFPDFRAELYQQANGPGTFQRLLKVLPEQPETPAPAVVVPFYFPEAMLGFELESMEPLPFFSGIAMMADLAKMGFICASADAYHQTYLNMNLPRNDFARWNACGTALKKDYPEWSGMGKLTADTKLVTDALADDPRVDAEKIGIAGHSLGGKMAFYAGCTDPRIKVILASDFGFCWEQSNWDKIWYWGEELKEMKNRGMEHWQLLEYSGGKPFFLIAGKFDDDSSLEMIRKAERYKSHPERLRFLNHASGHRPPANALAEGYRFLSEHLKGGRDNPGRDNFQ